MCIHCTVWVGCVGGLGACVCVCVGWEMRLPELFATECVFGPWLKSSRVFARLETGLAGERTHRITGPNKKGRARE